MSKLKEDNQIGRSREHQANERTFLAWIRTSIALMGFGFVIVKFVLFLKQLSILLETEESTGYSAVAGVIMVIVGVLIALLSYFQYKRSEMQIRNNFFTTSPALSLIMTLILVIGGVFLVIYLLSTIYAA
ncbi:MAG: DUF202 domain-containing protein [Bacteroidales bacterium]|jgi:putative membrane protein|nr:DUF202 domain-containing protein [Bacteroidales bacterium]